MIRIFTMISMAFIALASCTTTTAPPQLAADGKPLPRLYRISAADVGRIQFRVLDSVNSLRQASGAAPVEMNAALNAAAATHSRDMANQNRPWHFGSDGSSPIDRVARVGYTGRLIGETISETYETEMETLGAWVEEPSSREIILSPDARDLGFAWHQEANGKIWWAMVLGG